MEEQQNNQAATDDRASVISTFQLATAAVFLVTLAGGVFFIDAPFSKTPAAVAASDIKEITDSFKDMTLQAKSAIVVDLKTSTTLYEFNSDVQLPLASIAKIALVLVISEVLSPEDTIVLSHSAYAPMTRDHLEAGERWLVKDVIDYTLIGSSNGGAISLAMAAERGLHERYPASSPGNAALYRMNALVQELGLQHTFFLNTSGLDQNTEVSGAYGSARDIVHLLKHALLKQTLFASTAQEKLVVHEATGIKDAVAFNTNEALPAVPGLVFGKTGFTDLAGGNLAIVFEPEPAHPVAVVVLGSTQEGRFVDMTELVHRIREAL